jgi:protein-disulfide isomerase
VSLSPRSLLLLFAAALPLGCHAQKPADPAAASAPTAAGKPVTPELQHRIEVLLRQKASLPPGSTMTVSDLRPSDLPGWQVVSVTFSNDGRSSHPSDFLLSADGKTLAQFNKYDISANPRDMISGAGRPARGGPESAPVLIVVFDDLECPYCAKMHETIFPALTNRYGNSVRVVYKDLPLADIHPWAMRASIDANCLADLSPLGYWKTIDYVHAHAGEIGNAPSNDPKDKTVVLANDQLDKIVRQQGEAQKVDMAMLNTCIAKQDPKAVQASRDFGEKLGVDSTPTLFINGDKIDGALPIGFVYGIVDDALRAAGQTPPPPYVDPAAPAPTATPAKPSGAGTTGN